MSEYGFNGTIQNATMPFDEAFRVIKIDDAHWVGAHPLKLPITGARGVYGGHICAQALLVGLESAPEFVIHSLHSHFVRAGSHKVVCDYEVTTLAESHNYIRKQILVRQSTRLRPNRIIYNCIVSLVRPKTKESKDLFQRDIPNDFVARHPNPEALTVVKHTGWVKNAFPEEFLDYTKCPEEDNQAYSERWMTIYGGLDEKESFKDPKFNYVGLGCISDSGLLTAKARILHLPWNPTTFTDEEYDSKKDAQILIPISLNIMQLFHYHAMSLDHHIYFHSDDYQLFDVVKEWLVWSYQMKLLKNGRALVRGHYYKTNGQCIATVVQEGVTEFHTPVAQKLLSQKL